VILPYPGPLMTYFLGLHPQKYIIKPSDGTNAILTAKQWYNYNDLSRHALNCMIQVKTLCHTEKQGFDYLWFQLKPNEAEPSFRKVNLPAAKLRMLFPTHL